MKIKCQHPATQEGCQHCGMRGWVLSKFKATCCGREIWDSCWPQTFYVDKVFDSFNGVRMVVNSDGSFSCMDCVLSVKKPKRKKKS